MPETAVEADPSASSTVGGLPGVDRQLPADLSQLVSRHQAGLLDAIDQLRLEQIDADINIPQIVVCGDQSSGKSSVLEAIAGVPFPIGAGLTTKFATEVILRQSRADSLKIDIVPAADRDEPTKNRIKAFQQPEGINEVKHFGLAIEAAAKHLQRLEPGCSFWKDRLRVELSGPRQPHLTLIDLPGIIHYESEGLERGGKEKIKEMVLEYMKKPRTTVLAVIGALNNVETQEVLGLIRSINGAKDRTLGIITKPDQLRQGSGEERSVLEMAQNRGHNVRLGWHVLRNLGHDEFSDNSLAHRDLVERKFFEESIFSQLNPHDRGIRELRKKLSDQLFSSITAELPTLIVEMTRKRDTCKSVIERLGPERCNLADQRKYLADVLHKIQRLIGAGIEGGDYAGNEFELFFDGKLGKGLGNEITLEIDTFSSSLRKTGRQYHIYNEKEREARRPRNGLLDELPRASTPNFSAPYTTHDDLLARNVALDVYCGALANHIQRTRGTDLRCLPATRTVRAVFRQLSVPWESRAKQFIERCLMVTSTFLQLAVQHVAGDHTGKALISTYLYPQDRNSGLGVRRKLLSTKLEELLWPFRASHPMTWNPKFGRAVQSTSDPTSAATSASSDHFATRSWGAIARNAAPSVFTEQMIKAADVLDITEDYYEVALNTFIDNVTALGVYKCLLANLTDLFPADRVAVMDDAEITNIAAEAIETQSQRNKAKRQEKALEDVIQICQASAAYGRVLSSNDAQIDSHQQTSASTRSNASSNPTTNRAPPGTGFSTWGTSGDAARAGAQSIFNERSNTSMFSGQNNVANSNFSSNLFSGAPATPGGQTGGLFGRTFQVGTGSAPFGAASNGLANEQDGRGPSRSVFGGVVDLGTPSR